MASRAGTDELGRRLLDELRTRGLTTEFVQMDTVHPTGRVDITLRHGEPTYEFLADVAWDHLEWTPAWRTLAESCDAVVFGTLAQRCPTSRTTVLRFVETARNAVRLFDVNLRVTFFDADSLRRGAAEALETIIHGDDRSSRVVGKRIEELVLPEGTSIGCIARGDEVIMAHHDTVVEADDHVVLFITDRRHVDRVERLFLGETSGRR